MSDSGEHPKSEPTRAMRVAIEGCVSLLHLTSLSPFLMILQGHGTLDAIYESIKKSCEVKGWDGVDLVIIGGDFQVCGPKVRLFEH